MKQEYKDLIENVGDNTATVRWPSDQWGITSDLKKAIVKGVSNIRGQEFKEELMIATLYTAIAHIKKRSAKDKALQEKRRVERLEAAKARAPMERIQASLPVQKEAA